MILVKRSSRRSRRCPRVVSGDERVPAGIMGPREALQLERLVETER
jgi:hypothetical protein